MRLVDTPIGIEWLIDSFLGRSARPASARTMAYPDHRQLELAGLREAQARIKPIR